MNLVEMTNLDRSARAASLCEFCGRPWFGVVAYCPYCGRSPGSGQEVLGLIAGEMQTLDRSQVEKKAFSLSLRIFAAAASALLLLWMVAKPPMPESAPPASAAPAVPAAPAVSISPRLDTAVAPPSSRSLCSVAHEKAGLCHLQK